MRLLLSWIRGPGGSRNVGGQYGRLGRARYGTLRGGNRFSDPGPVSGAASFADRPRNARAARQNNNPDIRIGFVSISNSPA